MQEPKQIRSTSQLNKIVEILLKLAIADFLKEIKSPRHQAGVVFFFAEFVYS